MPDLTPGWALLLVIIALAMLVAVVLVVRPALARRAVEREVDAMRPQTLLRALGHGRPILLAVDVSGSMHGSRRAQEVWMKEFREAGAQIVTFDHELYVDDKPIRYGGGTNYKNVRRYVESMAPHPIVVMLTDGMFYQLEVGRPSLWHWALVDTGSQVDYAARLPGTTYTIQEIQ